MLKRLFSLMLMFFLLSSCAHHGQFQKIRVAPAVVSSKPITQTRAVSAFSQIDVQGQINVSLHTGYRKPHVILSGDPRDLSALQILVKDNTLYVLMGKGYPHFGPVNADIRANRLFAFSYHGHGSITGPRLSTSDLDLHLENQGSTRLGGNIGLHRLEIVGDGFTEISGINSRNLQLYLKGAPKVRLVGAANITNMTLIGSPWLSFYWLKSDELVIRAKNKAQIQLAGVVNRLDVELWDKAYFKGRYLRAKRSFVRTHGHSTAEISAVNHQSNLALDASDIFFYNLPNTRADFMAHAGSVLDMRDWRDYEIKDYHRYNKQMP